jgi:hypothetical protein
MTENDQVPARWQDELCDLLQRNNVTQFAYVPGRRPSDTRNDISIFFRNTLVFGRIQMVRPPRRLLSPV